MKIIVTGAKGFLGSHMCSFLEGKGHEVLPVHEDLRYYSQTYTVLNQEADYLFHFATHMGGVGYMEKHAFETFVDSMLIDANVFRAAKEVGIKRMFYPASSCMYPEAVDFALVESYLLPANPHLLYGYLKLAWTQLAKKAPFEVRVGILDTIFGEGQKCEGNRAKFPTAITHKVIEAKKDNSPIEIWGNGEQTRTFLFVDDAIEKIYEVMMASEYFGEVNIASEEMVTVKQCADWLCEIAGIPPNYKFDTSKPVGVMTRMVDSSKFNSHYKYRNRYTTKQGFQNLYNWMLKIYG